MGHFQTVVEYIAEVCLVEFHLWFILGFSDVYSSLTFPFALCMCPRSTVSALSFEYATFTSNFKGLEMHKMHSDTLSN